MYLTCQLASSTQFGLVLVLLLLVLTFALDMSYNLDEDDHNKKDNKNNNTIVHDDVLLDDVKEMDDDDKNNNNDNNDNSKVNELTAINLSSNRDLLASDSWLKARGSRLMAKKITLAQA